MVYASFKNLSDFFFLSQNPQPGVNLIGFNKLFSKLPFQEKIKKVDYDVAPFSIYCKSISDCPKVGSIVDAHQEDADVIIHHNDASSNANLVDINQP